MIAISIGKKLIHKNRSKRNTYSIVHYERLIEIERESEEICAMQYDKIEMYEKKWDKYKNAIVE